MERNSFAAVKVTCFVTGMVLDQGTVLMAGQQEPELTQAMKPPAADVREDFRYDAAIFRVCWGKGQAVKPKATWLASGGQLGLVRCQRVSLQN